GGTGDGLTHGGERPVRTLVGGQLDRAPTGSDDPFAGFVDGDAVQHRPQIWRFRLRHRCPSSILCVGPMQRSVTGADHRSQRQYRTNEEISPCIHASVRTHRTRPWPGAGTGRCSARGWPAWSFPWALMSACGDGEVDTTGDAEQLHEAQPPHYRDATQVPEGSENGVYSELVTVQRSAEVRDTTELDKPECLDASD